MLSLTSKELPLRVRQGVYFLFLAFTWAPWAFGDQVTVEWQAQEGAYKYELQVNSEKAVVFDKRFPGKTTSWKGSLPFGNYTYRLRVLDHDQRPSAWSEPVAFLVTPEAPRLLLPPDKSQVLYRIGTGVTLKWGKVKGVRQFLLVVKGVGVPEMQQVVQGTQASLPMLKPGEFTWQVKPILVVSKGSGGEEQSQAIEAKASDLWHFRLQMVKDALKFEDDLQKVALLPVQGNSPLKPKDYVCLYPKGADKLDEPVACGLVSAKELKNVKLSLLYQSVRLSDGSFYYLADPTRLETRGPASLLTNDKLYQVISGEGGFDFNVAFGIMAGTNYYAPSLEVGAVLLPGLVLSVRYRHADSTKSDSSLIENGLLLLATHYFGARHYAGFFAQAGAGTEFFSASTPAASQSSHFSLAGLLCGGWQWRPTQQGFNVGLSLGIQYLTDPKISLFPVQMHGLLPLADLLVGYAF